MSLLAEVLPEATQVAYQLETVWERHGITAVMLIVVGGCFLFGVYLIAIKIGPKLIADLQRQVNEERERADKIRKEERDRSEDHRKENTATLKEIVATFTASNEKRDDRDEAKHEANLKALEAQRQVLDLQRTAIERLTDKVEGIAEVLDRCTGCASYTPNKSSSTKRSG